MAEALDQHLLQLPSSLFHNKSGVSLDFGGSLIKIVYAKDEGGNTRFQFRAYPRESREEAFEFLRNLAKMDLETGPVLHTTGIGCNEYHDDLVNIFNKEVKNVSEIDVQLEAFQFISRHISLDELVHPADEAVEQHTDKMREAFAEVYKTWGVESKLRMAPFVSQVDAAKKTDESKSHIKEKPLRMIQYPYLVQTVGSAGFINLVYEDGTYDFIDDNPIAGRYFLCMGSLLAETDNYDELIKLVDEGDSKNVDFNNTSLPMNDSDPVYSSLRLVDRTCFSFGMTYGKRKNEFEKKDLARAVMSQLAFVTGLAGHMWAIKLGVKQIFVVGGLPSSSNTFRDLLGTEMSFRNKCLMVDEQTDFMFVKLGAHLGALGALLQSLGIKSKENF